MELITMMTLWAERYRIFRRMALGSFRSRQTGSRQKLAARHHLRLTSSLNQVRMNFTGRAHFSIAIAAYQPSYRRSTVAWWQRRVGLHSTASNMLCQLAVLSSAIVPGFLLRLNIAIRTA